MPLRYPLLLIDRVVSRSPGECLAIKNLTQNEACFTGHYPDRAIYPGSMLMESMAQAGYFMGKDDGSNEPTLVPTYEEAFLLSANLKFYRPAVPGDQIMIHARLIREMKDSVRFRAEAHVEGELAARGEFVALIRASKRS